MTEIDHIRDAYFNKGESISEIAKKFSKDRKTVRKYIQQDNFNVSLPAVGKESRAQPKLEPYIATVDGWLEEDKRARRKQRHTARRIYDRLVDSFDDFNCSYRTVAAYVKRKKKELYGKTDSALPLVHKAGEAQVDFGSADFHENGTLYSGKYLNVTFPFSNAGYLQLFKGENRECLFEGLRSIFERLGGVPTRLWFDNLSTVVTAILKDGSRKLAADFLRFKDHYGFDVAFCNPASGNEKGNVENKVGYHRRNLLVPIPEFNDLNQYNQELLERSVQDHQREHYRFDSTIATRHDEDKGVLLRLPSVPFDCSRYETYRVDAYGKIRLTPQHVYSTAPKYAHGRILVQITSGRVIPLDDSHRPITNHRRLYGTAKQEAMDWIPYLTQLSRNPGALKYTGIYEMLPDPLQEYMDGMTKDDRREVLKAIALLSGRNGFDKAVASVSEAVTRGVLGLDSLVTLHNYLNQGELKNRMNLEKAHLPELPAFVFSPVTYDAMLQREGV